MVSGSMLVLSPDLILEPLCFRVLSSNPVFTREVGPSCPSPRQPSAPRQHWLPGISWACAVGPRAQVFLMQSREVVPATSPLIGGISAPGYWLICLLKSQRLRASHTF